jgi:hypothetical protein
VDLNTDELHCTRGVSLSIYLFIKELDVMDSVATILLLDDQCVTVYSFIRICSEFIIPGSRKFHKLSCNGFARLKLVKRKLSTEKEIYL